MRAKIFIGDNNSGKKRVAEMITEHVGKENSVWIRVGKSIDRFMFCDVDEKTKLIVIEGIKKDFDFFEYFHTTLDKEVEFIIKRRRLGEYMKDIQIPQLIFIADELNPKWTDMLSFNSRFEIVEFSKDKETSDIGPIMLTYDDNIFTQYHAPHYQVLSNWKWLAQEKPKQHGKYTVVDKFGNVENVVFYGNSGAMNEPDGFFEGKIVKAKDIVAYR